MTMLLVAFRSIVNAPKNHLVNIGTRKVNGDNKKLLFQLDIFSSGMLRSVDFVVGYRRFEITYLSHLQWSRSPRRILGPLRFAVM